MGYEAEIRRPIMADTQSFTPATLRHDWSKAEIAALFDLPFMELVFQAATVHRQNFNPSEVQL
eukprot:gene16643-21046_t